MLKAIDAVRRATLLGDCTGEAKASKTTESIAVRVATSEDHADEEDFGIMPGTLQAIQVERSQWNHPHEPPLAISSPDASPLIAEFTRSWRVLKLQPPAEGPGKKKELSAEHTLLKNYEPRFTPGDATFPSETPIPGYLQPRVAVEDASAWLVSTRVRFALGSIEPLFCRLVIYDLSLGCRISEEFAFTLPASTSTASHRRPPPRALFYVLPCHNQAHLYMVLKVSKVLLGDADMATAPYCNPEKFASDTELQRLAERTADCTKRLGRYQQPIAWGAVSLADCVGSGARVGMTLYRQRGTMSDDTRLPLIPEAARGLLKEKTMPSVCELEVERVDEQRLEEAKFQVKASLKTLSKDATLKLPTTPMLEIHDPFSIMNAADPPDQQQQQDGDDAANPVDSSPLLYTCREVQPLCPPSAASVFGLYGSGPLAVSYTSAMFLYPLRLDRLPFRNVAVRVQLLQKEVEFVCGMDEFENQNALVTAFYSAEEGKMTTAAFSQVTYHQKNPQFEREIKLCLPEQLTMAHHLLITFYHVHCKKLQPNQQQQELVGCAALPLLSRQGALLEDSEFVLNVIPPSNASKNSTSGGIISMPAGYVETTRNNVIGSVSSNSSASVATENSRISFACRTRLLSSVRSRDASIAALMEPFQSKPLKHLDAPTDAHIVTRLRDVCRASHEMVRHFFLPITSFVLAYMRFSAAQEVRQAAFQTLLSVFEKVTSTARSQKPQDPYQILQHFIAITFDDRVVEGCASRVCRGSPPASADQRKPQSVLQAVAIEWIRLLNDKSQTEDVISTKRASLMLSNSLLQLILKAMASPRPPDKSATSKRLLPVRANRDDDLLIEELVLLLIEHTTSNAVAGGLLVQKEVNLSIARFCRGLFLVTKSALPIRIISYYLDWTQRLQEDVNVTVHILFPFLNTLIEFEFFAIVNGFQSPEQCGGRRGAWLVRLLFERLLKVVDEQVEDRIRSEALRLLRRMFVAQVYNPRHQTPEHQELIALMFFPMIPSVARFTTDGKLLASATDANGVDSASPGVFRKELLVCVAHLLSSVTLPYVSWYFRQSAFVVGENTVARGSSDASTSLSPTASLLYYRKMVEETKERATDSRRQSVIQRTIDKAFASAAASNRVSAYDEIRVHACLSLVRQVIEVFLVDDASMPSSAANLSASLHVLSPDLGSRDPRISLLQLEAHMRNRRSRHRAGSVGQDVVIAISNRGSAAAGSKSPLSKHGPSGRSFTSAASASASPLGTPRLSNQKSLPRNWGKNYVNAQQQQQQRVSLSGSEDTAKSFSGSGGASTSNSSRRTCDDVEVVDPGDEFETHTRNLHRIVADTVLKALRTAVDQFEWVLRTIEAPLDYRTNVRRSKVREQISMDQAFSLLGSLVDVFFLLLKRASGIDCLCSALENELGDENDEEKDDDDDCFLADLFHHLQVFLLRFQKALFATRITGLPLIHDQSRVYLLVSLSATAKLASVRQLASAFLYRLVRVCYDQTGSFLLIKRPIFKAFSMNFFSPLAPQIPLESLREAIDAWRLQGSVSYDQDDHDQQDPDDHAFELQFEELLNNLASQLKVFETWQAATLTTEATSDQPAGLDWEELEEGLYRVVHSVSPIWLLDVKTQWMDALIKLHVTRKQFAEATCCTLEKITFHHEEPTHTPTSTESQPWLILELRNAVDFAQQAQWTDQVVEIQERLLSTLRRLGLCKEYRQTLRNLDASIQQLEENQASSSALTPGNAFSFYRVVFAGDCVPMSVSRHEFVYKRSKFVSLGEFVGDIKAVLRARFPMCERVDILAESKPLPALERHPNVVFLRVTNVECRSETLNNQDADTSDGGATFSFSTPFVAGSSSSYGKTAEQMKRVTLLTTAKQFPCTTSRQVVVRRREVVRCPIDNAMDDIRKRCGLLQHEIANERRGETDLKTLTLVLKGSVDTHVHGGIPEVIDAFLTLTATPQSHEFPALLDCDGSAMDDIKSLDKREELADLLVEFLELCWACLLISRRAFRRSSGNQSHSTTETVGPSGPASVNRQLFNGSGSAGGTSTAGSYASGVLQELKLPLRLLSVDEECFSPLQVEFEKSFSLLVAQMHDRGTGFAYPRDGDLQALYDYLNAKQPSRRSTASLNPTSMPPLPPPPPASASSMVMPPLPPPVASSTSIT